MFSKKDWLHCKGTDLVNANGEVIVLRGTNLGGWLMKEGWMDLGGFKIPIKIKTLEQKDGQCIIDLGSIKRCNRIGIAGKKIRNYKILVSTDKKSWDIVGEGSFEEKDRQPFVPGRPVNYDLEGRTYCFGTYKNNDEICFDEVFARYICLETGVESHISHISRYGDTDDYTSRKLLNLRFGSKNAEALLSVFKEHYLKEEDLLRIKEAGFNMVRLPIYWQEILTFTGELKENAFHSIDWIVDWCRKNEIYIILDFHGAPGGHSFGSMTSGQMDSLEFWENKKYQDMSCRIIEILVERYKEEPAVAAFDLLNEPAPANYGSSEHYVDRSDEKDLLPGELHLSSEIREQVRTMYQRLYEAARSTGDHHVLSMQPFLDFNILNDPVENQWDQVLYQVHFYGAGWRNHDEVMKSALDNINILKKYMKQWNVPVLVGEFNYWEFFDVWKVWFSELKQLGIHWSHWTYKNVDPNPQDNWSLLYGFQGEFADLWKDTYEVIKQKWENYESKYFLVNAELLELLTHINFWYSLEEK